jgi:hypothetical protein
MMLWIHHQKAVAAPEDDSSATGRKVLNRVNGMEEVERLVVEGHIGSDAVPRPAKSRRASYYRARFHGHPMLVMTTRCGTGTEETIDTWFSAAALGAWRHRVEGDTSTPLPRRRTRVYRTGDEATPYVILGARIRRWNASQDLPKPLVGATADDPDGIAFLGDLGGRRWKPIVQPLVAEMVKEALRPVPAATPTIRYQIATIGEGQMIRYGRNGPVWIDADAAVHLADLAGYALGQPDEISEPLGGDGWSLLSDIMKDESADSMTAVSSEMIRTETVSYAVAAAEIGAPELKRVFPEYRWGRGGRHGERLRDDAAATYVRALYHGHPALGIAVGDRREWWMSSSAQAEMIETLHQDAEAPHPVPTETEEPSAPLLRKRQRKAVARLSRAIARLSEEGLSLVVDGDIKVRVEKGRRKSAGLLTVLPQASAIPNADQ